MTFSPSQNVAVSSLFSTHKKRPLVACYATALRDKVVQEELALPTRKRAKTLPRRVRFAEDCNVYYPCNNDKNANNTVSSSHLWYQRDDLMRFTRDTLHLAHNIRQAEMHNPTWSRAVVRAYSTLRQARTVGQVAAVLRASYRTMPTPVDHVGMEKYVFTAIAQDTALRHQEMMREMYLVQSTATLRDLSTADRQDLLRHVVRRYSRVSRFFARHVARTTAATKQT